MNWAFIIIIGVLAFIAYQLVKLNSGKKYEIELKLSEKSEEKIGQLFPNLYFKVSEEMKEEIRDFVTRSVNENIEHNSSTNRNDLAYCIYLGRYKIMNDKIKAEKGLIRREQMQRVKEDISKELSNWDSKLDSMINNGKLSEWEKDFILWHFIRSINDQFPERRFDLDDYFSLVFKVLTNEKTGK